jgi:hypothetical protein
MQEMIKPDIGVSLVGKYQRNTFRQSGYARGIKPEMYADYCTPIAANHNTAKP